MAKRIDWYLVELERMLKGRVPLDTLQELQTETRSHLEASRDALTAKGCDPDDSELEAVKEFGRPGQLAFAVIREHTRRPGPWVPWLAAAVILLAYLFPFGLISFGNLSPLFGTISLWPALIGASVLAGLWSRRSLLMPVCAALLLGALIMAPFMSARILDLSVVGGKGSLLRSQVSGVLANESQERAERESLSIEFEKAPKAFVGDDKLLDVAMRRYSYGFPTMSQVYLRSAPSFIPIRTQSFDLGPADDWWKKQARARFNADSPRYIQTLEREQREADGFYASVREAVGRPMSDFLPTAAATCFGSAVVTGAAGLGLVTILRLVWGWVARVSIARRALA